MRNEEFCITVLESALSLSMFSDEGKIGLCRQLTSTSKNRIGTIAADFTYVPQNGGFSRMRRIRAEYVLLYFHNPDCQICEQTARDIQTSSIIGRLQSNERLKVLAVYTGEDLLAWMKYTFKTPDGWLNGHNSCLRGEQYDLPAIPSIYLLDKNKMVLLKDASVSQIESLLRSDADQ